MAESKPRRKFSFNLSSTKAPPKSDHRSSISPKPINPAFIYARDKYATEFSPPPSPVIERRPLSPKTEAQLFAACASLVSDNQSSSHDQPKLNFEALHRSMREKKGEDKQEKPKSHHQKQSSGDLTSLPFLYPLDINATVPAKKYGYKPDTALEHLFPEADGTHPYVQANVGRRRDSSQPAATAAAEKPDKSKSHNRQHSASKPSKRQSVEKSALGTTGSASNSCSTPMTGSSDRQATHLSTAPSSIAALSPLDDSSKRHSRHLVQDDSARSRADAAAAAWMRDELDKRRKQSLDVQSPFNSSSSHPPAKGLGRKRSLRDGIREYIRPGSSRMSRQASQESLRCSSLTNQPPARSGSTHGWRSWSLQRKPSVGNSNSRPTSSKGHSDDSPTQPARPVVNLNRELPPLPSLDSWQTHQAEQQPVATTHIASLMRDDTRDQPAKKDQRREDATGAEKERKKAHRRSASVPDPSDIHAATVIVKESMHSNGSRVTHMVNRQKGCRAPSFDFDAVIQAGNGSDPINRPKTTDPAAAARSMHPPRTSSQQARPANTGPSMKISIDNQHRNGVLDDAPNFSRKMSADNPLREKYDPRVANFVEITAEARLEHKKGFKKFLGALGVLGKKKNSHWMAEGMDKENARKPAPAVNEVAGAPVVRY